MHNSIQTLPSETWAIILEQCENPIALSKVNKQLNTLAMPIFKNIKINMEVLCNLFYELQDLYTVSYKAGPGSGNELYILAAKPTLASLIIKKNLISIKHPKNRNNSVHCNPIIFYQKFADNALMNLKDNQIMISPSFGPMVRLDPKAYLRLNDRLPVTKITIRSNRMKPALLLAIKLAEKKANEHFLKLNGSYTDRTINSLFSFFNS